MTYIANYAPVTSELASAGIVLIPIALLFVLIFTTRVIYAALASLLVFLIIAAECYHMPWSMALIAACNGFLYVSLRSLRRQQPHGKPRALHLLTWYAFIRLKHPAGRLAYLPDRVCCHLHV